MVDQSSYVSPNSQATAENSKPGAATSGRAPSRAGPNANRPNNKARNTNAPTLDTPPATNNNQGPPLAELRRVSKQKVMQVDLCFKSGCQ